MSRYYDDNYDFDNLEDGYPDDHDLDLDEESPWWEDYDDPYPSADPEDYEH